ncbi:hypothetical protein PSCFBP2116_P300093 (plasmid) [Pseudomonas syringae]|uniref:Uncharacterized protein n=1 Tax=Pseudomonas syringae TaxID=317 RepID=A0A2K4X3V4_PSESX|nr:hypothetical protein CFBP3840_P300011 [Pseudomonas syringae]SPE17200.1 hypothetical protein PSCFBP2116_P300093 [Pseudomonas syringae]
MAATVSLCIGSDILCVKQIYRMHHMHMQYCMHHIYIACLNRYV